MRGPLLAIDARMYHGSGIATYFREVLPELLRRWPGDIRLLWASSSEVPPEVRQRDPELLAGRSRLYSVTEQIELRRLARGATVYFSPHYVAPVAVSCPVVVTVHDTAHLSVPQFFPGAWRRTAARFLMRRVVRRAAAVLTVSRFSREEIVRHTGIRRDRITVAPNGVDHSRFRPELESGDLKKVSRLGVRQPYALFVGNIKPHKNLAILLQAFEALPEGVPGMLALAGSAGASMAADRQASTAAEQLTARGRARWLGTVPEAELIALYRHAACVVQPSWYEGFGLPVIEALSCGAPVICSDIPALREAGGSAASYYGPPGDTVSLTRELCRFLCGAVDREGLSRRGVAHASEFTWERARAAAWAAVAAHSRPEPPPDPAGMLLSAWTARRSNAPRFFRLRPRSH